MYDMYPEWGPGRHAGQPSGDAQPASSGHGSLRPVQAGLDLRDNGGQQPDDN